MVHTFCLTHHHQLEYIAHMQKGAKEFLRVLQQTRDVLSVPRADAKEGASRAGEERQQAQERSISCVSRLIYSRKAGVIGHQESIWKWDIFR